MAKRKEKVAVKRERQKYLVLRNCFTEECVYYRKGDIVALPDGMVKDEKNFQLVGAPEPEPKSEPDTLKARSEVKQDQPETEGKSEPDDELEPSGMEPAFKEPVVHEKVPSKEGKKLKCRCGKTYKTKFGLNRHLEDMAK